MSDRAYMFRLIEKLEFKCKTLSEDHEELKKRVKKLEGEEE